MYMKNLVFYIDSSKLNTYLYHMGNKTIVKLSTYLGFGLQIARFDDKGVYKRIHGTLAINSFSDVLNYKNLKPVLRHIDDLKEEMIIDGKIVKFDSILIGTVKHLHKASKSSHNSNDMIMRVLRHEDVLDLARQHFDLYGWIESGDAVDIKTLEI